MQGQHAPSPWLSYALPFAIFAIVMTLRLLRMRRARRLRVERLWILPAIYFVIVAVTFITQPPGAAGWLWSALALAGGAAIGWYRGRMMRITVDPQTHALSQQASPASLLLLLALIAIRAGARQAFGGGVAPASGSPGHGVSLVTDIAMAFALGLIAATRIEMTIRARRLLTEARGGARPR